jgi:D-3-phosphoglycerate dehydrogenase / 2-oxoglutarate reductase
LLLMLTVKQRNQIGGLPVATKTHKVLCIQPIHDVGMKILQSRADIELVIPEGIEPQHWEKHLADTDLMLIRITKVPRWVIEKAPKLKLISRHGVGCDNIDVEAATQHGITVATVGEANAPSVVEHTVAMMLSLAKRLPDVDKAMRNGDFFGKLKLDAMDVGGATVLVMGLGRIGSRLVPVLNALRMTCIGVDPGLTAAEITALGAEPCTDFRAALPRADFVTVHMPLQTDTRHLIGAAELALMKPTAYLINCARGGIVDEAALLKALDSRQIKGAGVDVMVTEPPTLDDPLLKSDRLILSTHSAASTLEGTKRMATNAAQNILDQIDGKLPLSHVFNPEVLMKKR